jgi:hypothetical protein
MAIRHSSNDDLIWFAGWNFFGAVGSMHQYSFDFERECASALCAVIERSRWRVSFRLVLHRAWPDLQRMKLLLLLLVSSVPRSVFSWCD